MLARIRISVPDRPGSLGRVATALGTVGADIVQVEVLEAEAGRALDDVHIDVQDVDHLDRLSTVLAGVPGVTLVGLQHPAPPTTGHAELELVAQVLAQPDRALQTLVDGAPGAAGADWAACLVYDERGAATGVRERSTACPGEDRVPLTAPLRVAALSWPGTAGAALAPLAGTRLGLAVVRESGPPFHRSELWRLEQVGRIVGPVVAPALGTGDG
ncbi:ACT domain-containing protein [Kineosporiaceae bacterium SCSIO 59966]|nr:ACT domain-containing protein [Kineosporiaceae bacterium SCSIO 59966]